MKLSSMAAGGTAIDVEHFGRSGHRTALLLYIRALSEVSKITIDIEFLERGFGGRSGPSRPGSRRRVWRYPWRRVFSLLLQDEGYGCGLDLGAAGAGNGDGIGCGLRGGPAAC